MSQTKQPCNCRTCSKAIDYSDSGLCFECEQLLIDRCYEEQAKEIEKTYGKKAASTANYGWSVDELAAGESIATKVYRRGRPVLTSTVNFATNTITHDWN